MFSTAFMFCAACSTKHQPIKVNGKTEDFDILDRFLYLHFQGVDFFLEIKQWKLKT